MAIPEGPCVVPQLPPQYAPAAFREAIRERLDNAPADFGRVEPLSLGVLRAKRWEKGRRLGIALKGATKVQTTQFFDWMARGWASSCSLTFREAPWNQAEIRFTIGSGGNWSVMGTDVLQFLPSGQRSGNIEQFDRSICLHEVGHAIDLAHNMSLPNNPLSPDMEYLVPWAASTQGWPEEELRRQYALLAVGSVEFSPEWDPLSVMQYWQTARMNLQRIEIPPADDLSAEDRRFIGLPSVYGSAQSPEVSPPVIPSPPLPVSPIADPPQLLRLNQPFDLPFRAGTTARCRFVATQVRIYQAKIRETAPGSPVVDVVPAGGQPIRLIPVPTSRRDTTAFPVSIMAPGDYELQIQFRGPAPDILRITVSKA